MAAVATLHCGDDTVSEPTWDRVRQAMADLSTRPSGRRLSTAILTARDGASLSFDGSGGWFYVLVERSDGLPYQFIDSAGPDTEIEVLLGGVTAAMPEKYLCRELITERVVKTFFDSGDLDDSVEWEPL